MGDGDEADGDPKTRDIKRLPPPPPPPLSTTIPTDPIINKPTTTSGDSSVREGRGEGLAGSSSSSTATTTKSQNEEASKHFVSGARAAANTTEVPQQSAHAPTVARTAATTVPTTAMAGSVLPTTIMEVSATAGQSERSGLGSSSSSRQQPQQAFPQLSQTLTFQIIEAPSASGTTTTTTNSRGQLSVPQHHHHQKLPPQQQQLSAAVATVASSVPDAVRAAPPTGAVRNNKLGKNKNNNALSKTAVAAKMTPAKPPSKKRKLASTQQHQSQQQLQLTQEPRYYQHLSAELAAVKKTVQQLLDLLNLYGPLTAGQLEYNLPPIATPRSAGTAATPMTRMERVQVGDILQLLVASGLVQQVVPPATAVTNNGSVNNNSPSTTTNISSSIQPVQSSSAQPPPRYCVNNGIPRVDRSFPLPPHLMEQIANTNQEIHRSMDRTKRLERLFALPPSSSSHKSPHKETLRQIAVEHPETLQDPVYVTALKNLHVDLSGLVEPRARAVKGQSQSFLQQQPGQISRSSAANKNLSRKQAKTNNSKTTSTVKGPPAGTNHTGTAATGNTEAASRLVTAPLVQEALPPPLIPGRSTNQATRANNVPTTSRTAQTMNAHHSTSSQVNANKAQASAPGVMVARDSSQTEQQRPPSTASTAPKLAPPSDSAAQNDDDRLDANG